MEETPVNRISTAMLEWGRVPKILLITFFISSSDAGADAGVNSTSQLSIDSLYVSKLNVSKPDPACEVTCISFLIYYTPTAIMLARYVTHMNTQSPGGICYASLEVG